VRGANTIRAVGRYIWMHVSTPQAPIVRCSTGSDDPRVVISLTTTPSRITRLGPTLRSLLAQDYPPTAIYLAVPRRSMRENRSYRVPVGLARHPTVTIIEAERDWGPATKLLPSLRAERERPETLIIAVDDDNIYPREMVATFVHFSSTMPDAALCFRGWRVPSSGRWQDSRTIFGTRVEVPTPMDVITGCGGILVKPRFFDAAVFDYDAAPGSAFFVDDIWISGNLARRSISRYVIPSAAAFVYLPTLTTWRTRGLDQTDNGPGSRHNDIMLDYFRSAWGA
jgi:hypothetical protein